MTIEIQTLEDKILEIFRSVTQVPSLTADDDFFNSGGDSLLAVEAGFQISQIIDQEVDPMVIFVFTTASACAVAVSEQYLTA
ncbi:phosphopantetheine-binding protein [Pseudomonas syringae pv. actinidiae]|jgi:acyl carrier protein|uniref:Non-ribosomal peptide synthetase n=5 Tax=Pseudomonas syringae group TaxID=136849 RepID=A0A0P9RKD3_9PSED|nr:MULTISPECIES: phosphopantetheine-binding protein [Pseudomonas syringae group]EPN55721.1 non-ribosomal peptide synthetase [Pseudomonas syringae pv. actinidiae ICMP 19079]EPN86433.1 non-ribosomal peptide synthetase [Pseudomonas syringae pv. actinidiae ICMP 19101]AKT28631.1 hypothetical protein IYO_003780 [Pseudomonas syringae pv. actinidiae ICMP 18884]AOE55165.1 hypothetical protein NZ708_03775 [Pseudomonas syringae pv. actinidiae ICMP 18708]APP96027.1 hypothetical protein PsaNZ45_03775 [Pseu